MRTEELVAAIAEALDPLPEVRAAWLFGSQVSGRARPGSDLDVAIAYVPALERSLRERARRRVVVALADRLGALGERADVVDLHDSDPAVAFAAIRDGVLALERDRDERCGVVSYVARRYDDDAPRRALFRAAARRHAGASDGRG